MFAGSYAASVNAKMPVSGENTLSLTLALQMPVDDFTESMFSSLCLFFIRCWFNINRRMKLPRIVTVAHIAHQFSVEIFVIYKIIDKVGRADSEE